MRAALARNVLANVLTAAAIIGTALLSVPVIIDGVGIAGFGVWTLAQTVLTYVTTAETALGPAVQRFVAVAQGAGQERKITRLLWTSLGLYAVLGAFFVVLMWAIAPWLVDVFDFGAAQEADAEWTFRMIGVLMLLALLAAGLGNTLTGLERFPSFAATTSLASVAYLVALLLWIDDGLQGVVHAVMAQFAIMLVLRAWLLRDVIVAARPGFLTRRETYDLIAFSARLQVAALSALINGQTDKVVVGLVAPAATIGQLGVASQVAEAGRLVSFSALAPMINRMSAVHGGGDPHAVNLLFARLHRAWVLGTIGLTLIGAIMLYPLIAAWLGPGHGQAAGFGALLVFAYGANTLTGSGIAYLRAIGKPGLEARYGTLVIVLNVTLTLAMAFVLGPWGIVSATLVAYALGTVWFFWHLREHVDATPAHPVREALRVLGAAAVTGGAALALALVVIDVVPSPYSLAPVGLLAALALGGYLVLATGVRPTPAALRAMVGAGPADPAPEAPQPAATTSS